MGMRHGRIGIDIGIGVGIGPVLVFLLAACGYAGAVTPGTPAPDAPRCTVTAKGIHNISSRGPGVSNVSRNAETLLSCAGGPLVSLTEVASSGVSFRDGGDDMTIAADSTAAVGPYQVTVRSIDGGTAVFTMTLPA
jgi:hypothetical protein